MKKILLFLVASFVVISNFAQTNIPQLVSFSAVVRDANNLPLANTPVSIRLTFKQGGQNGPLVYCALHQNTTNQNGFISIQLNREVLGIGCNGAPSTAFQNIPWENGGFWMEVEYQTVPGSPFVNLGQLELASSFYAFAAGTAEKLTSITTSGAQNGDILVYNSAIGKFEPGQSGITSVQWADVQNKPNFATVATSGDYNDLINQPALNITNWNTAFAWGNHAGLYRPLSYVPTWSEVTNKPNFATVAVSGNYNDLSNKPTNVSAFTNDAGYLIENQQLSVSATGDTLRLQNGGFVIIPGISAANAPAQLATLSTSAVSSISGTTAISGGNITSDGGANITARGIVWSTSQNPTLSNNLGSTINGTGTGNFTSNLTALTVNTTYYVRAYATNSAGTAYGDNISFFTTSNPCAGVTPPAGYGVVSSSGKCWLDRNLGATEVATSSTDTAAYGDLYQWGRLTDGHQIRTSATTDILSSTNTPGNSFILAPSSPHDWRSPQNDNLWQGVAGVNNPCPSGYRLPTAAEWDTERASWISNNAAGAFASPLKLPVAGGRSSSNGSLYSVGSYGNYWSSTVSGTYARNLDFYSSNAYMNSSRRADGFSVRCLKD